VADAPGGAASLQARGSGAYAWPTLPRRLAEASASACWLAEHLLALPVHQGLGPEHMAQVAAALRRLCLGGQAPPRLPLP
ncbi:MAG: hypothetical protein GX774_21355, partial [Armatimonadetes bacterium]|nr:hypothetical protein [Armatimonadota bacterium]